MDFASFYGWSVDQSETFWRAFWEWSEIIGDGPGEVTLQDADKMPGATFFPEARINFAENLLRRRDDSDAIVFRAEDKVERRLSHRELYETVARLAQALREEGVQTGDRVAGFMPNMPETVIAMLATASLGAIWSSCSPDFGHEGVLDRFGQIEPKVLSPSTAHYAGKTHRVLSGSAFAAELPSVQRIVVCPLGEEIELSKRLCGGLEEYLPPAPVGTIDFQRMPFNTPSHHVPRARRVSPCIVHGAGGT